MPDSSPNPTPLGGAEPTPASTPPPEHVLETPDEAHRRAEHDKAIHDDEKAGAALTGAGAEMRQALGTAVFYGMIGVTVFGLFLTPVFFQVIRKLTRKDVLPTHDQTATDHAEAGHVHPPEAP